MQRVQVLFPNRVIERLRAVARQRKCSVSELVQRAVERLLGGSPVLPPKQPARFPTFRGGGVLVHADRLRNVLHGCDDEVLH